MKKYATLAVLSISLVVLTIIAFTSLQSEQSPVMVTNTPETAISANPTTSDAVTVNAVEMESATATAMGTVITESDSAVSESVGPTVSLVGYKSEGPASVDIAYSGLIPGEEYGVTLCMENGGCLEWVETFVPASSNGEYRMDVRNRYAESKKGLSGGIMRLMLFRGAFGKDAIVSEYFTIIE